MKSGERSAGRKVQTLILAAHANPMRHFALSLAGRVRVRERLGKWMQRRALSTADGAFTRPYMRARWVQDMREDKRLQTV